MSAPQFRPESSRLTDSFRENKLTPKEDWDAFLRSSVFVDVRGLVAKARQLQSEILL